MNIPRREIHFTHPTKDGWKLRLFFYSATTNKKAHTPVILCHGLAGNKNSCDFGDFDSPYWHQYSLAAFLSQGGLNKETSFDVWVPELRGLVGQEPHGVYSPKQDVWCVDDHIQKDVPTIISYVQRQYVTQQSQQPKIFWIGKSMGGMIVYGYGETASAKHSLQGVVTIGSPIAFTHNSPTLELISRITPRNIYIPVNVSEFLSKHPDIRNKFLELGANNANIDQDVFEYYLNIGMNNTFSSKVLSQFSVFFRHHTFCRYPRFPWLFDTIGRFPFFHQLLKPYDYKQQLTRFTSPILILSGQADREAPPEDVSYATSHIGSKDVTSVTFSKQNGYSADYGHLDLNLGRKVKLEVYPIIYNWLLAHDQQG